ncbi:MAG: polysaccharide deacetylase family protein [Limisphaerales bacterium]
MSRFHITLVIALLLAAVALALGSVFLFVTAVVALLFRVSLGVAIPQMSFFGPFLCSGDNSQRRVALTFDDGPDARSTPALLDLLRDEKIEATFFCIGKNVTANRELTARICAQAICSATTPSITATPQIFLPPPVFATSWRKRRWPSKPPRALRRHGFARRWAYLIRARFVWRRRWD